MVNAITKRPDWRRAAVLLVAILAYAGTHGGAAFGDQRIGFNYPIQGYVMSGWQSTYGWALYDTVPVTGVTLTVGSNFAGYANYGDPRPDVCSSGPQNTWPACAGASNVGWDLTVNTAAWIQGAGQTATITVAPLNSTSQQIGLIVDQPPTITLASVPPSGSGSGIFSFSVNTSTGNEQWINGAIASSLGATPACSFTFYPNQGSFALINDANNTWMWGSLTSGLSNSQCRINSGSNYVLSGDGKSGTLNLDITFLGGMQGYEQIWMITADNWLDSGWTFAGYWNTQVAPPTISSFSPSSGSSGTMITLYGNNFQPSPTVTIGGMGASMMGSSGTSITAMIPTGAPTGMQPLAVTVNGMTATAAQPLQVTAPITIVPTSGPANSAVITVSSNGNNIGSPGTVFIGAATGGLQVQISPTTWNTNQIVFTIPYSPALTAGFQIVSVNPQGASAFSIPFTLTPGVTSLSRISGPAQMGITITGTNFGASPGNTVVRLNGTPMMIDDMPAWTGTSITAQVPSLATSGAIAVTVNNQTSPPSYGFSVSGSLINCGSN